MSAVTSIIEALPPNSPYYTFEVFPPKTEIGTSNLVDRIERMSLLSPSWIHVTWGAGGSTQDRSLDLVGEVIRMGKEGGKGAAGACLHLTCTNMERTKLEDALERAKAVGVVNLLALRGDPPRGQEYWTAADNQFQHATDLVKYIKAKYGETFCIGVAGYPEGHADSSDKFADVEYLFQKQEAGADFVVTQLFYDVDAFVLWYRACRARGITIPILPGIMPIQNYQSFRRMTNLCKSSIPPNVVADLERIENDDAAVKEYGINLAVSTIRILQKEGVRGFHLCTLNLEKSVKRVLEILEWVTPATVAEAAARRQNINGIHQPRSFSPVPKAVNRIRAAELGSAPSLILNGSPSGDGGRKDSSPTSWDEFPNGRFGDARSPAYGDLDGWGVGLKLTPAEALTAWGHPKTDSDISTLFSSYLSGTLAQIPWSDEPLRPETNSISEPLIKLNDQKNWWTVGSQPAVDGCESSDEIFGFGPAGGYVYQKSFVELFLTQPELELFVKRVELEDKRLAAQGKVGLIKYFAGNRAGLSKTNLADGEVNVVTWGVFAGRELVTTTLIEEMSFTAWKEEAFAIWGEWSHLYPIGSDSRTLIEGIAESRWLLSVVHHGYKDEGGLWKFLLEQ